jgi:hypothetical protein
MSEWRPNGWKCKYQGKKANRYFELGASAMLNELFRLATESPTGTFTIDSHSQNILKDCATHCAK